MWNIGHFGCTAETSCYAFIAKVTSLWISNQKIKNHANTSRSCCVRRSCWRKGIKKYNRKTWFSRTARPPTRPCSLKACRPAGELTTTCRQLSELFFFFTFAAHSDVPMEFHVEFLISYFVCWTHHLTVVGLSYKYTKLLYSGPHVKYDQISCITLRILKSQMYRIFCRHQIFLCHYYILCIFNSSKQKLSSRSSSMF